jgi:hypothetical protein
VVKLNCRKHKIINERSGHDGESSNEAPQSHKFSVPT